MFDPTTTIRVIAIHASDDSFSAEWINHARQSGLAYRIVDCHSSSILDDLSGVDALFWDWRHYDSSAQLYARQLLAALHHAGTRVFPAPQTGWFYDDKIAQAFLFNLLRIPSPKTHVFFRRDEALRFVDTASWPLVWKLRTGAGSMNVELVGDARTARRKVKRAFGRGFDPHPRTFALREFLRTPTLRGGAGAVARSVIPHPSTRYAPVQRGYAIFQEFVPDLTHDIRIVVVNGKAFGFRRFTRDNDFRASGSGKLDYGPGAIPAEAVSLAFRVSATLGAQCMAYDFVEGPAGIYLIECSYAFVLGPTMGCPGYWTEDLQWHTTTVRPAVDILEVVLDMNGDGVS